jgi:hypothetical protein
MTKDEIPAIAELIYMLDVTQATTRFLFKNFPNKEEQLQWTLFSVGRQLDKYPNAEIYKAVDNDSGEALALLALSRHKPKVEDTAEEKTPDDELDRFKEIINLDFRKHLIGLLGPLGADIDKIEHYGEHHMPYARNS